MLHQTHQNWGGGEEKWANPLTGQHFVGVGRTQVQSQDSRNAGAVQTLRAERTFYDFMTKYPNTTVEAGHHEGVGELCMKQYSQHGRPLGDIYSDPQP